MKQFNYFLFSFFLLLCTGSLLQAQQRYIDEVFTDVNVTYDVTYGVNATVLYFSVLGEAIPEELKMDVYEPAGDTLTERPLIVLVHTGNFLPQPDFCQVIGRRDEEFIVETAMRLARMGYVVAVIDYRYGWNPVAQAQEERVYTLINAAYRGIQDLRTCFRFFRRDAAENGNTFGIDVNRFVAMGDGTGGYITLAAAALDEYQEIILPKFTIDVNGVPVPMVLEAMNGNIEGTSVGVALPGTPFPMGDTLCYPNHTGYSSDFQLSVNFGGAMGDTSWIDENTVPIISFHNPYDSFAPYMEDILKVPTTGDLIVEVQGSYTVQAKMHELGLNDVFATEDWIDPYSTRANEVNDGFDGLFPVVYPPEANLLGDTVSIPSPWHWWDPADWVDVYCDLAPTVDLATQAAIGDPSMTPERGMAYTDTLIAYFAPRACLTLDLGCDLSDFITTSTNELIKKDAVGLTISPNPASDVVEFSTLAEHPMQDILLYNAQGRLVQSTFEINNNRAKLNRGELSPGIYIARIRFAEGVVAAKVVFK